MRLSTQFKITLLVFSLALIIIAVSIAVISQEVNKTRTQENLAYTIVQGASDLTYLSNDYVIYQGDQQLSQWQTRYTSFSQDVSNLNEDTQGQQELVSDIVANQQRMKTVFDSIVATIKNQNANPAETLSAIQVSWSRISIQTQAVSSDGTRLAQLLRNQVDQLNTFNSVLIFAIVGTFSAFLGVVYVQAFRRTLKAISELREGAAVIGSGNLDHKLEDSKKDEIGELSHTFNQMADNLKSKTKQLQDSERLAAIGATAGMVGHDIRNPLQAITGDLYLVKTELDELPDHQQKKNALESLDEIQNNIDYINKIVADLQDYARPLKPRTQETSIKSVINETLKKNGIPKEIKLTIEVEDKAERIMADPDYLKRIFSNLTLNAVQAMPNGGTLTIRAFADMETNDVLITVKDTGVGIPEDVKPKLFTPMMTTKSKGQGFGLAVVKRMAEGLGGTVTFESQEGKGTTFTVRLPPKS